MKHHLRIPIRLRLMLTFLLLVTTVVGLITFSTASLFQEDKQAYVNGLTSMVVQSTAEEARGLLMGYRDRVQLYGRLLLESETRGGRSEELSQTVFDEFPELVAVSILRDGREPLAVYNMSLLESAQLEPGDLVQEERARPLPLASIDAAEPFLRNTTISSRLPCFSLVFRLPAVDRRASPFVSAVLHADRLQELMSRFTAYTLFLADSEGNLLAHSDARQVLDRGSAALPPQMNARDAELSAGVTREYERSGTPMIGGVAQLDFGRTIAGAEIPRSAAHLASQRLIQRLLVVAGFLLVGAVLVGIVWAHRITKPVERLSRATRLIGSGRFDIEVEVDSADEIGELGASFNQMTDRLRQREAELGEAHKQLVQSEKMAAFGQLGAGIAHEVKNPLAGILACVQLMTDDAEQGTQFHDDLRLIEKETRRCKTIIDNLMKFARQEQAEKGPTDVNLAVKDALAIVNHQLELHEVRSVQELQSNLPLVHGNANQLQQVFINLLVNAQQAMEGRRGSIRVTSCQAAAGSIELRFTDTGPGIPEELRGKLFEPFFTTKPPGKGTGLGLSVSYGIVKDHGGEISVESEVGKGTTFVMTLPRSAEQPTPEEVAAGSPSLA